MQNDQRTPLISISKEVVPKEFLSNPNSFASILVTASITSWPVKSKYPHGTYIGKLGQIGEIPIETEALLVSAGISWGDFSESVLDCLPLTVS